MSSSSDQNKVSEEVLKAYYPVAPQITNLSGGEINSSWLAVDKAGDCTVIQRLSPIFEKSTIEDMSFVVDKLTKAGWEVPQIVKTIDGGLWKETKAKKGSSLCRVITYIDSDGLPKSFTIQTYKDFGYILGRLHRDLAQIKYTPKFKLPHFHETEFYIERLKQIIAKLPDNESTELAKRVLQAYAKLPRLPLDNVQLIHGDPKTDNLLFKNGSPFTFIDWDTVMKASVWIDIGDRLRSLVEDSLAQTKQFLEPNKMKAFMDGYQRGNPLGLVSQEFYRQAIIAMQRIALELATRYIIDIVEDYYWTWDNTRFNSRRDSNMARATIQWDIYAAAQRAINP